MAVPFYSEGLNFSCIKCSSCCRHEPGYVFLRKSDAELLERALKMKYTDFVEAYCRWVPSGNDTQRLSLKDKPNFDCIFWKNGCTVYEYRPVQCRSFPFWPSCVASAKTWKDTAAICPGVDQGALHTAGEIKNWLKLLKEETVTARGED